MSKVYFSNEVHDKLIGMASHLMMLTLNMPNSHKVARDIHQTLLSEYLQDVIEDDDFDDVDFSGEDH